MIKKFLRAFAGDGKSDEHTVQVDSEEMKEETHELEQVEQDEQEEAREIEDQE
jgi:hypothetical protein